MQKIEAFAQAAGLLGAQLRRGGPHQLGGHPLAPQALVHKGVVDVRHAVLPCGEGDFRQQLAVLPQGENPPRLFLELHTEQPLSFFL